MLCPYCQLEYTAEQPCFCQPPATAREAQPELAPDSRKPAEVQALWYDAHGENSEPLYARAPSLC